MGRLAPRAPSEREQKDQVHALVLKGRYEEAITLLGGLIASNAREPGLRLQLAEVLRKRGRLDDAVQSYQQASALLAAAGHTARARAALACALQVAPGEPVLVAALRALQPEAAPRHLALVPPPPAALKSEVLPDDEVLETGFEALDDESRTDPFCPLFDWLEEARSAPPKPIPVQTVPQRPRR